MRNNVNRKTKALFNIRKLVNADQAKVLAEVDIVQGIQEQTSKICGRQPFKNLKRCGLLRQKSINHVTHPLSSAGSTIFSLELQIKVVFFSSSFDFYWVFKSCLNQYNCNYDGFNKMGNPRPISKSYFEIKLMTSQLLFMTSPTKFYHLAQIILKIRS